MKSAVLRFPPRQSLRAVLAQPRRPAADARRVRDPLVWVAIGVGLWTWCGLAVLYWLLFR